MRQSARLATAFEEPEEISEDPHAAARPNPQPTGDTGWSEALRPAPARPEGASEDPVAELEAALLADLQSVSALLDAAAEEDPAAREPQGSDAEAMRRVLATISAPTARSEPEPEPRPREAAPQPTRPAARRAPRPPATPARPAPQPPRRLQSSVFIGAALLAVAGGGAFLTVQQVTGHGTEPAVAASPAVETAAPKAEPRLAEATEAPARPAAPANKVELVHLTPDMASDPAAGLSVAHAAATPPPAAPASIQAAEPEPSPPAAVPASEPPARLAGLDPAPAPAASRPVGGGMAAGPGRITDDVKLRSNPDNGAPVIGLLGSGTRVQVVACKGWCEVVVGDKRGFVYRRFLAPAG